MSKLSEELGIIATIDPQTVTTAEVCSDVVDMSKYTDVMAIFAGGNMASDGSMICVAYTCAAAGTSAVALKTATTVAAGTDNTQVVIEVNNNDLAGGTATTADRYIKFGITSAGSGGPVACIVLGRAKNGPSSDNNLGTVNEIEIHKD
jgi:hypothetical protein